MCHFVTHWLGSSTAGLYDFVVRLLTHFLSQLQEDIQVARAVSFFSENEVRVEGLD